MFLFSFFGREAVAGGKVLMIKILFFKSDNFNFCWSELYSGTMSQGGKILELVRTSRFQPGRGIDLGVCLITPGLIDPIPNSVSAEWRSH
jgi:hypothetical protein